MANVHAQRMRRQATKAEWVLWRELKQLRAFGFVVRRQVPFARYILDFVSHRELLVVEVDGDQHGEETQRRYDEARTGLLEAHGYRVLRVGNRDVLTNLSGTVETIYRELVERRRKKFGGVFPPPEPISPAAKFGSTAPRRRRYR
jgi:very-short-patch-repair endonuclease